MSDDHLSGLIQKANKIAEAAKDAGLPVSEFMKRLDPSSATPPPATADAPPSVEELNQRSVRDLDPEEVTAALRAAPQETFTEQARREQRDRAAERFKQSESQTNDAAANAAAILVVERQQFLTFASQMPVDRRAARAAELGLTLNEKGQVIP